MSNTPSGETVDEPHCFAHSSHMDTCLHCLKLKVEADLYALDTVNERLRDFQFEEEINKLFNN